MNQTIDFYHKHSKKFKDSIIKTNENMSAESQKTTNNLFYFRSRRDFYKPSINHIFKLSHHKQHFWRFVFL